MTDVAVSIEGAQVTTDLLGSIAARVADTAPLAVALQRVFLDVEAERFDAEGPGWADLAPSTLAQKARKGYPSNILEATGALKRSLTEAGAAGCIFLPMFGDATTSVTFGTDLRPPKPGKGWEGTALAAFHQLGTTRMPSRPVIDDNELLAVEWAGVLALWLASAEVPE